MRFQLWLGLCLALDDKKNLLTYSSVLNLAFPITGLLFILGADCATPNLFARNERKTGEGEEVNLIYNMLRERSV